MTGTPLELDAPVYVAGHNGLVGSAVWRRLEGEGFTDLIGWRSAEVDLRDRDATFDAVLSARPAVVVLAAAKVGGILANSTYPVDFLNDNLRIQTNVFEAAHAAGVERLLFLGSSCIYPKLAPQPIPESRCSPGPWSPPTTPTRSPRSPGSSRSSPTAASTAGTGSRRCPPTCTAPATTSTSTTSHVLPAMIRKFHEAKVSGGPVTLWGTGTPRREFLHVDDLADAVLHLLRRYDSPETINVGSGKDVSIRELAETIAGVVGLHRRDRVGRVQARRHAAQAARHVAAGRARAGRRGSGCATGSPHVRLVPGERAPDEPAAAGAADPSRSGRCRSGWRPSRDAVARCWHRSSAVRRRGLGAARRGASRCTSPTPTRLRSPTPTEYAELLARPGSAVFTDGVPVTWVGRSARTRTLAPVWDRVYGPDVMEAVLDASGPDGPRHYLLGGSPETLAVLESVIAERWPAAIVVGAESPPFRALTGDRGGRAGRPHPGLRRDHRVGRARDAQAGLGGRPAGGLGARRCHGRGCRVRLPGRGQAAGAGVDAEVRDRVGVPLRLRTPEAGQALPVGEPAVPGRGGKQPGLRKGGRR